MTENIEKPFKKKRKPLWKIAIGILALSIVIFNIYTIPTYLAFNKHLESNYPGERFVVYRVHYDILYERFYAKARNTNDGTEFSISTNYEGSIEDNYNDITFRQRIQKEIMQYFKGGDVKNVFVNYSELKSSDISELKRTPSEYSIDLNYEQIEDTAEMAAITEKAIATLQENGFAVSGIFTTGEIGGFPYSLMMAESDISKSTIEIEKMIIKLK